MQQQQFNQIQVAQRQAKTNNELLTFLEETIIQNSSKAEKIIDLTGYNTQFSDSIIDQKNLEIIKNNLGKNDGYTDMRGIADNRKFLANEINTKNDQNINENDIYLSFGLESALWMIIATLIEKNDVLYAPVIVEPFLKSITNSFGGQYKQYQNFQDIQDDFQSLVIYNPQFLNVNQTVSLENAQQILQKAKKCQKAIVIIGDIQVFLQANKDIEANLIWVQELNSSFKGWKASYFVLFGQGFEEVKKGLTNLSNVILMQNTVIQSSFIDLYKNEQQDQIFKKNKEKMETLFEGCNFQFQGNFGVIQINSDHDDKSLCTKIYEEHGIKLIPGSFYGLKQQIVFNLLSQAGNYQVLKDIIKQYL